MVHALEEAWRVLVPGGALVDLLPLATDPPLEIISDGRVTEAGPIDESPFETDLGAAKAAMAEMVGRGALSKEESAVFDFAYYWADLEGMTAYIEDRWSDSTVVPEATMARARELERGSGGTVQVRIKLKTSITRYRKIARYRKVGRR